MTERDREARRLRLFLARLEREEETATDVHGRLRNAAERVQASSALYLQNFYTSIEEVLRRIAAELDGSIPAGDDWHRELVGQMTLDVPDVRPRLIDDRLRSDLDLLRRFRHLVRHAYGAEYDWDEMQAALHAADRVMKTFPEALDQIRRTVRLAITELEGPA